MAVAGSLWTPDPPPILSFSFFSLLEDKTHLAKDSVYVEKIDLIGKGPTFTDITVLVPSNETSNFSGSTLTGIIPQPAQQELVVTGPRKHLA